MKLLNKNAATKNPAFIKIKLTILEEYNFGQGSNATSKHFLQLPFSFFDDDSMKRIPDYLQFAFVRVLKKAVSLGKSTLFVCRSDFDVTSKVSLSEMVRSLINAQVAEIIDDAVTVKKRIKENRIDREHVSSLGLGNPELTPPGLELQDLPKSVPSSDAPLVKNPQQLVDLWLKHCPGLPKIIKLTNERRTKIAARLKNEPTEAHWIGLFKKVSCTPFLLGDSKQGWKADFDWIIGNETRAAKVLEGGYDSRAPSFTLTSQIDVPFSNDGAFEADLT